MQLQAAEQQLRASPSENLRGRGTLQDLSTVLLGNGGSGTAFGNDVFVLPTNSGTGATIWHAAAERGDAEVLRRMHALCTGNGGDARAFLIADKQGRTPLAVTCQHGKQECAEALLAWGADPMRERDRKGRLPIHLAAQHGGEPVVSSATSQHLSRGTA